MSLQRRGGCCTKSALGTRSPPNSPPRTYPFRATSANAAAVSASRPIDLAIVGGGLAGGLIALALRARRPELRTVVIEEARHAGGNHVWSCFETDVAPQDRWL